MFNKVTARGIDGSSDTFQYDFAALMGFLGASDLSVKPGDPGHK
jgi:hypothetical protein